MKNKQEALEAVNHYGEELKQKMIKKIESIKYIYETIINGKNI